MNISQGINLALDRILKKPVEEQILGIPEPEQVARHAQPLPKVKEQPPAKEEEEKPPEEEEIPPPPIVPEGYITQQEQVPAPVIPEGFELKPTIPTTIEEVPEAKVPKTETPIVFTDEADNELIGLTVNEDLSVTYEGQEIGRINPQTGEFEYIEPSLWQQLLGGFGQMMEPITRAIEKVTIPVAAVITQAWTKEAAGKSLEDQLILGFPKTREALDELIRRYKATDLPQLRTGRSILPSGEELTFGIKGLAELGAELPLWLVGGQLFGTGLRAARGAAIARPPKIPAKEAAKLVERWEPKAAKGVKLPKPEEIKPEIPAEKPLAIPKAVQDIAKQEAIDEEKLLVKIRDLFRGRQVAGKELIAARKASRAKKFTELTEIRDTAQTLEEFERKGFTALKGKDIDRYLYETLPDTAFSQAELQHIKKIIVTHPAYTENLIAAFRMAKLFRELRMGKVPTEGELIELERVFGEDVAKAMAGIKPNKAWQVFMDVTGLPKALKATADLSYTFRQVLFTGIAEPKIWGKNFIGQVKAFAKQSSFDDGMLSIKAHPAFKFFKDKGLDFTEFGARIRALGAAEEAFPTRITELLPIMKQSNRAAVYISNKMRYDIAYKYWEMFGTKYPQNHPVWKGLVDILNASTGRGVIPRKYVPSVVILNRIFFSPRFALTPFQMLYFPARYTKNPLVRRFAMRSWFGFIGLNTSLFALGKTTGLWDMELDPTSSNFGRARIGDVRIDIWHGYLPWIRLISRMATGTTKTETGEIIDVDKWDALVHTIRGKFDPITGAIANLLSGRTYVGEEFPPPEEELPEALRENLLPMAVNDVWDGYATDLITGASIAGTSAMLGVNAASYPSRTFDEWADYLSEEGGKKWTYEELYAIRDRYSEAEGSWEEFWDIPTSLRRNYLETHPEINASMYFWGERNELYSPEARDIFMKMLEEYNVSEDLYPMRRIEEPWEAKDKTEEEIFADYVDVLPSYLEDYALANKEVFTDIPSLIKQLEPIKKEDRDTIDRWNRMTMGEDNEFRERVRKEEPETDVVLNFWGEVKIVKTTEAYNALKAKADELGIPHEVIPALSRKEKVGDEEIDRAYDYLDIMPKYLLDYIDENRDRYTFGELEALTAKLETWRDKDLELIDKYSKAMEDKPSKLREAYRHDNPDVDVALNLWGKIGTVQSPRALSLLRSRIDELGIDRNVLKALQPKAIKILKPTAGGLPKGRLP